MKGKVKQVFTTKNNSLSLLIFPPRKPEIPLEGISSGQKPLIYRYVMTRAEDHVEIDTQKPRLCLIDGQ